LVASIPDFQPLYKQVYAVLVRRIAAGEWRPAQALPSEQALAEELAGRVHALAIPAKAP